MTALQWLDKNMIFKRELFVEAEQLFEQQIKDAYNQGFRDGKDEWDIVLSKDIAESNAQIYYNKTFKK